MMFYPNERTALFIDGANLYGAAKALGFDIDYSRMHEAFARKCLLVRGHYYTALTTQDDEFTPLKPLVDWLDYHGWKIITKPAREFTDGQGRRKIKGNMDVELAVDAMAAAAHIDHFVIFSGDGDFRALVEALQRQGKRVSVVSTIKTTPAMCADELRRAADNFIELEEIRATIERAVRPKVGSNA